MGIEYLGLIYFAMFAVFGAAVFISLMSLLSALRSSGKPSTEKLSEIDRIVGAWRALAEERGRIADECNKENDVKDGHIALLMQQLSQARIEPVTVAQAESVYETIQYFADEFSIDELDTLMLSIGVYPESIRGETIDARARELVLAADRRGKLTALVTASKKERP